MSISRKTVILGVASVVAGALWACRSRGTEKAFLAVRVPVAQLDSFLRAWDSVRLPLADARILFRLTAETTFTMRAPRDTMTVADMLAWARADEARRRQEATTVSAAERAHADSLRRQLDSALVVSVVSKTFLAKDPEAERYDDYISLTFAYHNKGTKTITAFQGDIAFLDTFGDTIYSAHLKVDTPLRPGQTRREPERVIRYNPLRTAHQRLRNTPLSRMRIVWQSTDGMFAES